MRTMRAVTAKSSTCTVPDVGSLSRCTVGASASRLKVLLARRSPVSSRPPLKVRLSASSVSITEAPSSSSNGNGTNGATTTNGTNGATTTNGTNGVTTTNGTASAAVVYAPSTLAPAPAPAATPATLPPPKIYEAAVALGVAKANLSVRKIFTLGILAGVYIGFGSFLALSVGGACPGLAATNPGLQKIVTGAFGLPFGLMMVLICGGELFTGNAALVTTALHEKKVKFTQLLKSWCVSYAGNVVGSLALVACVFGTGLFATAAAPIKLAVSKTSLTFTEAFFRGVLCNWLVCIAIWQATAAKGLASKAVAIWFPISSFIALGLEHCVANMFIIPMGILVGAPVTWGQFLGNNLLPVTLGNIVGGALCVATSYAAVYGRLSGESK